MSAYAGILAAALVGLVTGYLFGRVVTRLAGFYLALTTFALALALPPTSNQFLGAHGLSLDITSEETAPDLDVHGYRASRGSDGSVMAESGTPCL